MYLNLYNFNMRLSYTKEELETKLEELKTKELTHKEEHDLQVVETLLKAIETSCDDFHCIMNDLNSTTPHNIKWKLMSKTIDDQLKYGMKPIMQKFNIVFKTKPANKVNSRLTHGLSPQATQDNIKIFLNQSRYQKDFEYTGEYQILSEDRKVVYLKDNVNFEG